MLTLIPSVIRETLVTILEAVSRLALWKKVSIATDDPRVNECVRYDI